MDIPNADALVQRSCSYILGVGGDGNGGDTILDAEGKYILTSLDIPETNGAVTAA